MVIALVDPYSIGHHHSYLKHIAEALVKMNHTAVIFTSKIDSADLLTEGTQPDKIEISDQVYNKSGVVLLDALWTVIQRWYYISGKISQYESIKKTNVDLVFFSWLDSYLFKYIPTWFIERIFPYKWSGIYLHPTQLRQKRLSGKTGLLSRENIIKSDNCIGIGLLDKFIVDRLNNRLHATKAIGFPDFIGTDLDANNALRKEILTAAQGRVIVGMITIQKRKGVINFMRLTRMADPRRFYFVLIGTINRSEYSIDELQVIDDFYQTKHENVFTLKTYLKDEVEFNSVFETFTFPWVAYTDFTSSSNILTRATFFRKPVLSTASDYIGECVKKYNLGVTVNANDPEDIKQGLLVLEKSFSLLESGNFQQFYDLNRLEALMPALTTLCSRAGTK
jgi:glycosyltransferase involved in cell wall biosynthesis